MAIQPNVMSILAKMVQTLLVARLVVDRNCVVIIAAVLLLVSACNRPYTSAVGNSASGVTVSPATWNCDYVMTDEILRANGDGRELMQTFVVSNETDAAMSVEFVGTDCGCSVVSCGPNRLRSGALTRIGAHCNEAFDFGIRAPNVSTDRDLSAVFRMENGELFKLRALLCSRPQVTVSPNVLVHRWLDQDKGPLVKNFLVTQTAADKNDLGDSIAVVEKPQALEVVAIEKSPLTNVGSNLKQLEWKVETRITYLESSSPQPRLELALRRDEREVAMVRVPISIRKGEPLNIPRRILFGRVTVGNSSVRHIIVSSLDHTPFTIKVVDKPSFIDCTIDEMLQERHRLAICVRPVSVTDSTGVVHLETNHPLRRYASIWVTCNPEE